MGPFSQTITCGCPFETSGLTTPCGCENAIMSYCTSVVEHPLGRSTLPWSNPRSPCNCRCSWSRLFVLWTLRTTVFFAIDESITSPTSPPAYSDLLKLVMWVLPAAAFAFLLRGASPAKYLGLSVWPSLRNWMLCLGVTVIFLVAVAIVNSVIVKRSFSAAGLSSLPIALWLLQLVISPLLEELLFRGFIMKELLTLLPAHLAITLNSLLFVGAHLPFWLSHGGVTQAMVANAVGVFVFSTVACWLFAKTASIWPPTDCAAFANNILSSLWDVGHV